MKNRDPRSHPRVTGLTGVEVRSRDGRFACRARDVSLAGCYVESRREIQGSSVEVLLQIPGQLERAAFKAQVMRTDSRGDGTVGLALKFLTADWAALLGLARLVSPQLA